MHDYFDFQNPFYIIKNKNKSSKFKITFDIMGHTFSKLMITLYVIRNKVSKFKIAIKTNSKILWVCGVM